LQSFLEAVLEVETKAVAGVGERVARGIPGQLEDVIKFKPNAVVLDIAGAGYEPHRIDKVVFHEQFAVRQPIERARLPRACTERELHARTRAETPHSGDGVGVRVGRTPPFVTRPVIEMDVR